MIIAVYLKPEAPIDMNKYRLCHLLCGRSKNLQSSLYAVPKQPNAKGKKEWRIIALRAGHGIKNYIEENSHRDTINITQEMDNIKWQKEYLDMKISQELKNRADTTKIKEKKERF